MSKYDRLWAYVGQQEAQTFQLTFEDIAAIGGVPIDHSFLTYKKELTAYGYQVGKISRKEQTVTFHQLEQADKDTDERKIWKTS